VIDGTTGDQRFFYGYARAMPSKSRDEALLAQLRSDPHSSPVARVNGAVRNHPAFDATFGVRPGDGMYLAPEERVSIW
jgi:predicted metalloendopeptidase